MAVLSLKYRRRRQTMNAQDKISVAVIVPAYNSEQFITQTLESIARQSYPHFEVLIVDDGSTDNSADIAQRICDGDPRFRLTRKKNEGAGPARHLGIEQTAADWIAICDADDLWHKDKLKRQIEFITSHGGSFTEPLVALGTGGYHVNVRDKIVGVFDAGELTTDEFRRRRDSGKVIYMLNSSVIFRREAYFAAGGYREDYAPAEDVELWTRMAAHGAVVTLSEKLTYYRMHGTSMSDQAFIRQMVNTRRIEENSRRRTNGKAELSFDEYLGLIKRDPRAFRRDMRAWTSQQLYRRGAIQIVNGQYVTGASLLVQSFLRTPVPFLRRLSRQLLGPGALVRRAIRR